MPTNLTTPDAGHAEAGHAPDAPPADAPVGAEVDEEVHDTTADADPVEPADVGHFPAAPSAPSEVVEPTPPAEAGDPPHAHAHMASEGAVEPQVDAVPDVTATPEEPAEPESRKKWYIIKVTSGREESIKAAIERRVRIEGVEEFFGQVYIPVERITEVKKVKETKNGERITKEKRVVKARKKFPGYLMAEVEFNDQVLYLFRETSGVGDFVGTAPGKIPSPMADIDVQRMLADGTEPGKDDKPGTKRKVVVKLDFEKGDKVRIRDGAFASMEGEIKEITLPKDSNDTPKVTVVITIFGRGVETEHDYWQVDKI